MRNVYTHLKNTAIMTTIGLMAMISSRPAMATEPVSQTTKTVADTTAKSDVVSMLDKQYADIANALKILTQAMNRPDVNRHTKYYADMVKMYGVLMNLVKGRDTTMNVVRNATGAKTARFDDYLNITMDKQKTR